MGPKDKILLLFGLREIGSETRRGALILDNISTLVASVLQCKPFKSVQTAYTSKRTEDSWELPGYLYSRQVGGVEERAMTFCANCTSIYQGFQNIHSFT